MHIVKSIDGDPRKIYYKSQGNITSKFLPGSRFDYVKTIDPNWSMKNIARAVQLATSDRQCAIPNLPKDGTKKNFQIAKRFLRDDPRLLLAFDVDSSDFDLLGHDGLRDRVRAWIHSRGLPQDLGFVAKWSSSRFLLDPEKRSAAMHIILRASDPVSSAQFDAIARGFNADHRMAERGRILAIQRPTSEDSSLFSSSTRFDEIIYQEGQSLVVGPFLENSEDNELDVPRGYVAETSDLGASGFFKAIKDHYQRTEETVPWRNIKALCKTSSQLLRNGRISHRHAIHYWLLRLCFHSERDCYSAIAEITNDKFLLGKHTASELFHQMAKVKHDFRTDSSCGEIQRIFEPGEIVHVSLPCFSELEQEDLDAVYLERGTIVIRSGEGSGKTFFLMRGLIDRFDPETIGSICHRLNCLHSQSEQWGLTYQYDIGKDDPQFRNLSETERKKQFIPDCDTPAITWQALDYINQDGNAKTLQVLLLDEIEHTLEEFVLNDNEIGNQNLWDTYSNRFYQLLNMVEKADLVILADAMISEGLTGWFLEQTDKWRRNEKRLLLNHEDYVQRMAFYELESREEAILTAIEILKKGETLAICSDFGDEPDKPTVNHIAKIIRQVGGFQDHQIQAFHRGDKDNSRPSMYRDPHEKVIAEIDRGMICSIFSPAFDTGWQIAIDDPAYTFDNVMLLNGHGLTHAEKCKEFLRRFRYTKEAWIYIKKKRGKIRPHQLKRYVPQAKTEAESTEPDFVIS